jgi:hypothetical protein
MAENLEGIKAEVAKLAPKAGDLLVLSVGNAMLADDFSELRTILSEFLEEFYPCVNMILLRDWVNIQHLSSDDLAHLGLKRVDG